MHKMSHEKPQHAFFLLYSHKLVYQRSIPGVLWCWSQLHPSIHTCSWTASFLTASSEIFWPEWRYCTSFGVISAKLLQKGYFCCPDIELVVVGITPLYLQREFAVVVAVWIKFESTYFLDSSISWATRHPNDCACDECLWITNPSTTTLTVHAAGCLL